MILKGEQKLSNQLQINDEYCANIVLLMILYEQHTHFNKLHRELKNKDMEMSKPTLSLHLKHLTDSGIVIRKKVENTQLVSYSLNSDNAEKIKEFVERGMKIMNIKIINSSLHREEEFLASSAEEQFYMYLSSMLQTKLQEIKAQIDYKLDPQNLGKKILKNLLNSPILQADEMLIIKNSVENEYYRKKILKIIDDYLEKLEE
jgi:DNA-binding HxlR family transcriptional regulator